MKTHSVALHSLEQREDSLALKDIFLKLYHSEEFPSSISCVECIRPKLFVVGFCSGAVKAFFLDNNCKPTLWGTNEHSSKVVSLFATKKGFASLDEGGLLIHWIIELENKRFVSSLKTKLSLEHKTFYVKAKGFKVEKNGAECVALVDSSGVVSLRRLENAQTVIQTVHLEKEGELEVIDLQVNKKGEWAVFLLCQHPNKETEFVDPKFSVVVTDWINNETLYHEPGAAGAAVTAVGCSANFEGKEFVATGSLDGFVSVFDQNRNELVFYRKVHHGKVTALSFARSSNERDKSLLVSVGTDSALVLTDLKNGSKVREIRHTTTKEFKAFADKKAGEEDNIELEEVAVKFSTVALLEVSGDLWCCAGTFDTGEVLVFSMLSGSLLTAIKLHDAPITKVVCSRTAVYSCGWDSAVVCCELLVNQEEGFASDPNSLLTNKVSVQTLHYREKDKVAFLDLCLLEIDQGSWLFGLTSDGKLLLFTTGTEFVQMLEVDLYKDFPAFVLEEELFSKQNRAAFSALESWKLKDTSVLAVLSECRFVGIYGLFFNENNIPELVLLTVLDAGFTLDTDQQLVFHRKDKNLSYRRKKAAKEKKDLKTKYFKLVTNKIALDQKKPLVENKLNGVSVGSSGTLYLATNSDSLLCFSVDEKQDDCFTFLEKKVSEQEFFRFLLIWKKTADSQKIVPAFQMALQFNNQEWTDLVFRFATHLITDMKELQKILILLPPVFCGKLLAFLLSNKIDEKTLMWLRVITGILAVHNIRDDEVRNTLLDTERLLKTTAKPAFSQLELLKTHLNNYSRVLEQP